jgi:predicted metal-dependent phosphoesterase TrpH
MSKPLFSYVHGLEVCNGSLTDEENALALRVAEALGLLKFGGSDAHTAIAVGTCVTRFDTWIHNERDFVEAILAGCFVVEHGR